jgi:hypothetical protein
VPEGQLRSEPLKKLNCNESSRLSLIVDECSIGRCIRRRARHAAIRCDPQRWRAQRIGC